MSQATAEHWDQVYGSKAADRVSWYQPHLETSIRLLEQYGLGAGSALIDVGGGVSTLVDDLLPRGLRRITVVDLSAQALEISRRRLGAAAGRVQWLAGDVTRVALERGAYDFWHDRAVLHFLTGAEQASAYARQAAHTVRPGGFAIIAGFAPDGPAQCSGLPVARRSAQDIEALFGTAFALVANSHEQHRTPAGGEQSFLYSVLWRLENG